ncbi:MAG: hypothetical protein ACTSPG_04690 [Candidatus Hodarchaeales archaeon]
MHFLTIDKRRGQLQIAETLVAVSLMLVLALLLISASNTSLSPDHSLNSLDQTGYDVLSTADDIGYLRPTIYLFSIPSFSTEQALYHQLLDELVSSTLSDTIGYALTSHIIENDTPSDDYEVILGSAADISALQYGGDGVIVNYLLGSFSSAQFGYYNTKYLVQLYLWEKI